MNQSQGETAVTTSALILAGLYAYRKTTETITKTPSHHNEGAPLKGGLKKYVETPLGIGELAPLGEWATGMGFTFILLSVMTSVNATFGGSFAILIGVGAVLGNGQAVLKDLGHGLSGTSSTSAPPSRKQPLEPLQSNHPPAK